MKVFIIYPLLMALVVISAILFYWLEDRLKGRRENPSKLNDGERVMVSQNGSNWYERIFCHYSKKDRKYHCKIEGAENYPYTLGWKFCEKKQ